MDETVSRLIAGYLLGVPGKSRAAYRKTLDDWCRWCSMNTLNLLDVRRMHIEAYGEWVRRLGLSEGTVAARYTVVCGFYRYAFEEGWIPTDPGVNVRRPHSRSWSEGSWLMPGEARRFLELAEADRRAWVPGVCCLLLLNGLRVSEPLVLNIDDFYARDGVPVVRTRRKFDWMQEVAVADRTAIALRRAIGVRAKGALFMWRGRRVRSNMVLQVVAEFGERIGVPRRITPHSLRRTFATLARASGVPDREIMASGGWKSRHMIDYYDMGRLSVTSAATSAVAEAVE